MGSPMWGRDPLALTGETIRASSEAQQIAQAMFQGVVPAGVTQIAQAHEARVTVMPLLDQEGQVLTPEMRAARAGTRKPYNPNDLTRNYQAEHHGVPETRYDAADKYVPQLPRVCREVGAAIRGVDFKDNPLEAGTLPAPPKVKKPPETPVAPQFGGVLGLSQAPQRDTK